MPRGNHKSESHSKRKITEENGDCKFECNTKMCTGHFCVEYISFLLSFKQSENKKKPDLISNQQVRMSTNKIFFDIAIHFQ